jgi:hypothetical protein
MSAMRKPGILVLSTALCLFASGSRSAAQTDATLGATFTTLHSFDGAVDPGYRWELVRDHGRGRGQRRRNNLQNHPEWHADHALQLLVSKWLP